MKRLITKMLLLSALFAGLLMPAQVALAADPLQKVCNNPNRTENLSICHDDQANGKNPIFGPDGILTSAINLLSIITGVIAVIFAIVQGLRMIISDGDSANFAKARKGLIYALVGLAIALVAQAIVAMVLRGL